MMFQTTSLQDAELRNKILYQHENCDCDEVLIVSGYLGIEPIEELGRLTERSSLRVTVFYGLYAEVSHNLRARVLQTAMPFDNLGIVVPSFKTHAKLYVWRKKGDVVYALAGSLNFSSSMDAIRREVLFEVSHNDFGPLNEYIAALSSGMTVPDSLALEDLGTAQETLPGEILISFLNAHTGELNKKADLNWWNSSGNVAPGDAYIPLLMCTHERYGHLLPIKKDRNFTPIDIVWDDGFVMPCTAEGGTWNDTLQTPYNKIASRFSKSLLGKYLWKRIGRNLPIRGETDPLTRKDLEGYGRTSVTLRRIDENTYEGDFSV